MAKDEINLGVIGMSEGNGHPYSWSAIFNGYNPEEMKKCGFPVIPEYLAAQQWPEAKLAGGKVSHIWTQDEVLSNHISRASLIWNIVDEFEDLIGTVDAILLARDDAENHVQMAIPFLEAGIPIYVDKPFALCETDALKMLQAQKYEGQLFTCSAMRYAQELYLTEIDKNNIGTVRFIEAQIPKSWEKYAVHILEPIITGNPERGSLLNVSKVKNNGIVKAQIEWENLRAEISTYGRYPVPLQIKYFGEDVFIRKYFKDTFNAFKASLADFIKCIKTKSVTIPRNQTLEIMDIIERVL